MTTEKISNYQIEYDAAETSDIELEMLRHTHAYASIMGDGETEKVFPHPCEGERAGFTEQVAFKGCYGGNHNVRVMYPFVNYTSR